MTTSPIVTITDELLAELEAAANAATKGRWCTDGDTWICAQDSDQLNNGFVLAICQGPDESKNAAYMAKASAAVILALLTERADHLQQLAAAAIAAENCELFRKDAERYRKLRTVTPYRFKKIQDQALTDGGDVLYFHADRFDAAIDAARSASDGS